jgi:hypothetical protein
MTRRPRKYREFADVIADRRRAVLVDRFLRPRLGRDQQVPAPPVPPLGFVSDADAYASDPAELAAAHARAPVTALVGTRPAWYFVSPARRHGQAGPRCRAPSCKRCGGTALPGGEWIPQQASERHAEEGGVRHVRRFFYVGDARGPKAPAEWIMVENSITKGGVCDEELVFCELYRARPQN